MNFISMQKRRANALLAQAGVPRSKRRPLERLVLRATWEGFEAGQRFARAGGEPFRFWQFWRWLW